MSDGSLSQEEIDALLMGDEPQEMPPAGMAGQAEVSETEMSSVSGLLQQAIGSQGATLSGIMMKTVTVGFPTLAAPGREAFLSLLSDEVTEIRIDYKDGLVGQHLYVLSGDDALKIAGPMIGQDDLELDGAAINAVGEAMNQFNGSVVSTLEERIGRSILTETPEGQSVPKAVLGLPGESFVQVFYDLQIEGQGSVTLYEIFETSMIKELASLLGGETQPPPPSPELASADTNASMPQPEPFEGLSPGGLAGSIQSSPSVQGVQLPELTPGMSGGEQRNISLLMDVSMELTVELGRTKWRIKEILGMGEGTIIELDKLAGEPVDILVNNNLIARGEVVVIDENFGVRVTEIVSTMDRLIER